MHVSLLTYDHAAVIVTLAFLSGAKCGCPEIVSARRRSPYGPAAYDGSQLAA